MSNSGLKINRKPFLFAVSLLTMAAITEAAPLSSPDRTMLQAATSSDSILIWGTVHNEYGAPIENAQVIIGKNKTLSDKNGYFHLNAELNKPAVIQFSYGKLQREVRNYHPLMTTTIYDVILYDPCRQKYEFSPVRPIQHVALPDSLSIPFESSSQLSPKTQNLLKNLANFMRDHPVEILVINSYYNTSKQKAVKISNLVKDFLVSEQGILFDRIQLADPQLRKENEFEVFIEFALLEEANY